MGLLNHLEKDSLPTLVARMRRKSRGIHCSLSEEHGTRCKSSSVFRAFHRAFFLGAARRTGERGTFMRPPYLFSTPAIRVSTPWRKQRFILITVDM
jgi:hypothetical protein